jgi:transposase
VHASLLNTTLYLLPLKETVIGIGAGIEPFATPSNEKKIDNIRFFCTDEKVVATAQRRLAKTHLSNAPDLV